jgi:hypothetical protein
VGQNSGRITYKGLQQNAARVNIACRAAQHQAGTVQDSNAAAAVEFDAPLDLSIAAHRRSVLQGDPI